MKTITLLAVMAILLQSQFGTTSSVGGPLTMMLILCIAMLAVGLYEAWLKKRGPLGWMVNIVAALVGGFLAASLVSMAMPAILTLVHFQGRLVSSHHPVRYVLEVGMAIVTVLGSWAMLQLVNRLPARHDGIRSGI